MLEKLTKAMEEDYQQFQLSCLRLVEALTGLREFQRRFHPLATPEIFEDLWIFKEAIILAGQKIRETADPEVFSGPVDILKDAINRVLDALDIIIASKSIDSEEAVFRIMQACRNTGRLQEKLYGIRHTSPYLDRFFLEPQAQHPVEESVPTFQRDDMIGLQHIGTEGDAYVRGAPSLYVPESYDGKTQWPLVVSLHGGSGHGRDFIWTWLREARTREFILLSPTSKGKTWSFMNPEVDGEPIVASIARLKNHYNIDTTRILLTGMSDGGTFALICSLVGDVPFTAFAPIACVLPTNHVRSARGKRIYWVHGALDWMFPVDRALKGGKALKKAGADITLRIIDDLSHTYPREENDRILEWFDPRLSLPV